MPTHECTCCWLAALCCLWQRAHVARFVQLRLHAAVQQCDLMPATVDVAGSHCVSTNIGAMIWCSFKILKVVYKSMRIPKLPQISDAALAQTKGIFF